MKTLLVSLILLIFTYPVYSQVKNDKTAGENSSINQNTSDSLNQNKLVVPKAGFKIGIDNNPLYYQSMLYKSSMPNKYFRYKLVLLPSYNSLNNSPNLNMHQLKQDFQKALSKIPVWQAKTDLGLFGQILGYTQAAAAAILIYQHFHKYKDEY